MNSLRYKLIIFDFDGTVADTKESVIYSFQKTLRKHKVKDVKEKEIEKMIGDPLIDMFRKSTANNFDDNTYQSMTDDYRSIYSKISKNKTTLFKDIKKVLAYLQKQNVILSIASNKKYASIIENCVNLEIRNYFKIILGADSVTHPKPHPEMIEQIQKRLGIKSRSSILYVGDTTIDMEFGNNAKVDTCAVTWGIHTKTQLELFKPKYIINSAIELFALV